MESNQPPQRIAKVIAHSGLCSRRRAEELILQGNVTVDGKLITKPATFVSNQNIIKVNGKILPHKQQTVLYKFYKPKNVITSRSDPEKRTTIYDILPKSFANLIYVGRLDYNSEGLLLLTNNGSLSRKLELPSTGITRTYKVRVYGSIHKEQLDSLINGINVNNITYGSIRATIQSEGKSNHWLTMTLTEGKNREIRNICQHFGLSVNRLIRTSYGHVKLGNMKIGEIINISETIDRFS